MYVISTIHPLHRHYDSTCAMYVNTENLNGTYCVFLCACVFSMALVSYFSVCLIFTELRSGSFLESFTFYIVTVSPSFVTVYPMTAS